MRAMNIRVHPVEGGFRQMMDSFRKNRIHYLQESLGLAIFMISACFFGSMLEARHACLHQLIPNAFIRLILMGILMGLTALFIFYSPFTAPSGSHINPAVTLVFLRLGRICHWDALFYILFQFLGGVLAVYFMAFFLGNTLTDQPVNYVATVPGKYGAGYAAISEFLTAFIMITMVLFTSESRSLKRYTRVFAGCFVCLYVIIGGPISGFGMNPARSFASAFPSHTYTAFWIYMIIPFAGMLGASEIFNLYKKRNRAGDKYSFDEDDFFTDDIKTA